MERGSISRIAPSLKVSPIELWRAASLVAFVMMELSWIVPGYQSLSRAASVSDSLALFSVFAGVLFSAWLLTWISSKLHLGRAWKRALFALALLACSIFALQVLLPSYRGANPGAMFRRVFTSFQTSRAIFPFEFQILIAVSLFWLRGVFLSQSWIGVSHVLRSFQFGAGSFLLLGFLNVQQLREGPGIEVLLFLLSGLVAMASARTASLGLLRGAREPRFKRTWILSMLAAAVFVVGMSAVLGVLASINLSASVAALVRILFGLMMLLLLILVSPLILVMALILPGFLQRLETFFDLQGLAQRLSEVLRVLAGFFQDLVHLVRRASATLPDLTFLRPYLLWALLLALIALVLRRVGKGWRERKIVRMQEDEVTSLLDQENMLQHIRAGLQRRVRRFVSRLAKLRVGRRLLAAARIRRIYAKMMDLVASLDHPRPEAQTPSEYLSTLISLFPKRESDVRLITEAYNRVRYGQFPETRHELVRVEDAWRRVRDRGREMVKNANAVHRAATEWTV